MDLRWIAGLLALAVTGDNRAASPMVGFLDAATLGRACGASARASDAHAICLGYVAGAADQLLAAQAARGPGARTICIPPHLTAADVVQRVNAYAVWTKDAKGISAASFVESALQQAYPCDPDMEPM